MDTNDFGHSVIDLDCCCRTKSSIKHCNGNLYIQPDKIQGERVFMVSVTDTRGDEDADMWLSREQVSQLISELELLLDRYGDTEVEA